MLRSVFSNISKGAQIGLGICLSVGIVCSLIVYAAAPWGALPTVQSGSGLTATAWNDLVNQSNTLANTPGLRIKKGYAALVSGITYHAITPTNTYTIPVTLPSDTKGVIIGVKYLHNGSVDHGYLDFWAYQQNTTAADDKAFFTNYHYNDYYNTDYYEQIIPWNNSGSGNAVTIQVTYSYNDSSNNKYDIVYAGYIAGR